MKAWLTLTFAMMALASCHHRATPPAAPPVADAGASLCPEPCPEGTYCKLVMVQCVRAPCPPIPECVPLAKP
jgi:hypothetical protein